MTNDILSRAQRAVLALREPHYTLAHVPNAVRDGIAEVIADLIAGHDPVQATILAQLTAGQILVQGREDDHAIRAVNDLVAAGKARVSAWAWEGDEYVRRVSGRSI